MKIRFLTSFLVSPSIEIVAFLAHSVHHFSGQSIGVCTYFDCCERYPIVDDDNDPYFAYPGIVATRLILSLWHGQCTFGALSFINFQMKSETRHVAVRDGVPCRLLDIDPLTDPSFPVYPANVMQVYELHEYT